MSSPARSGLKSRCCEQHRFMALVSGSCTHQENKNKTKKNVKNLKKHQRGRKRSGLTAAGVHNAGHAAG